MRKLAGGPPDVRELVIAARAQPSLLLPRYRANWRAHALVLAGVSIGVMVPLVGGRAAGLLGWLALTLLAAGMLAQWRQRRPKGWHVDFERRTLMPQGLDAAVPVLDGSAALRSAPAGGAGARAVELLDARGAALQLFAIDPTVNQRETAAVRELADVLATRLNLARAPDID